MVRVSCGGWLPGLRESASTKNLCRSPPGGALPNSSRVISVKADSSPATTSCRPTMRETYGLVGPVVTCTWKGLPRMSQKTPDVSARWTNSE